MLDIIFLSYQEPDIEKRWFAFSSRFPWAKRVDGVKGILEAHRVAASTAKTFSFFVVDADTEVLPTFDFSYCPNKNNVDAVHVWRARNPVNDLAYGFGGVKLFPRELVLNFDGPIIDFTTHISNKFKVMFEIASITQFNTSPFDTWRSAFRECVKLSSKSIDRQKDFETDHRLEIWCSRGKDRPFGDECINGAQLGKEYGRRFKGRPDMLEKINDFNWLKERFDDIYVK